MPRVKNISAGRYYHRGTGHLSAGDTADVSEELAEYLCEERGFGRVDDEPAEGDVDPEATESDRLADVVDERTIPELETELEAGEYDDQLDTLADAERGGQDRDGVHDAIEARRDNLEE